MKKRTGIWIDTEHAFIIDLNEDGADVKAIDSHIETRPRFAGETSNANRVSPTYVGEKNEERKIQHELDNFLEKVLHELHKPEELVIFGPAQTKHKLENKLLLDKTLSPKKLDTVAAEAMSKNQMVAWVKDYFSHN